VSALSSPRDEKRTAPAEAVKDVCCRACAAPSRSPFCSRLRRTCWSARARARTIAVGYARRDVSRLRTRSRSSRSTDKIRYLETANWAIVTRKASMCRDVRNKRVKARGAEVECVGFWSTRAPPPFMAKDIHEQPEGVRRHTSGIYLDMNSRARALTQKLPFDSARSRASRGRPADTAYYAGMVAKYWFERFAAVASRIDVASSPLQRGAVDPKGLAIFGVAVFSPTPPYSTWRDAERSATCATPRSRKRTSIDRERERIRDARAISDAVMPTLAGPEIGVPRQGVT